MYQEYLHSKIQIPKSQGIPGRSRKKPYCPLPLRGDPFCTRVPESHFLKRRVTTQINIHPKEIERYQIITRFWKLDSDLSQASAGA